MMKALIFLLLALNIQAATFSWNPNPESDISYYRLYVGNVSSNYITSYVSIGIGTNLTVANSLFIRGTNYAALTAVNTSGLESAKSLEISFVITNSPPNAPVNLKFIAQ